MGQHQRGPTFDRGRTPVRQPGLQPRQSGLDLPHGPYAPWSVPRPWSDPSPLEELKRVEVHPSMVLRIDDALRADGPVIR